MNDYFDTSRRIMGILTTHPSQVHEVAWFANAFSPPVDVRMHEIPAYLKANNGRMLPIIDLSVHLFDRSTGVLVHDYGMVLECLLHHVEENHKGRVLFWWNEIMWQVRIASFGGKRQAETEVLMQYENLKHQALLIGQEVRRRIPGSGVLHIEAYAELLQQMATLGGVVMFDDCEYLAFDAYGPIDNVAGHSQHEYLLWVWNVLRPLEETRPIGRKLFLIPGAFKDRFAFPEERMCVDQFAAYINTFDAWDAVGGIGVFTYGTVVEEHNTFIGSKHLPVVGPEVAWRMSERK